jgi:plasmid stabilization system protein ParE
VIKSEILSIAEAEFSEAIAYYETESVELALRFIAEFDEGVLRIRRHPKAWEMVTRYSRRYRLRHFPYGLVYQLHKEKAVILAVAHLHRDQAYWRGREVK